jgi:hypothetical protein
VEPFKRERVKRGRGVFPRLSAVEEKLIRSPGTALWAVRLMYGSYVAAREWVRRYRPWCERNGQKYLRDEAIDKAAEIFGIDREKLANGMNRSRRRQKSTAETP